MDIEDICCKLCNQIFSTEADMVPRLIPENGLTYCTGCLQIMLDSFKDQPEFICEDDEDQTPVGWKQKAEQFPKNFAMIKMANKYKAQQQEQKVAEPTPKPVAQPAPQQVEQKIMLGVDMCPTHGKKFEIICIDCKERICSNCALFGKHKPHDIRLEQDVFDEINIRTECLMEMYQIVDQTAAEKPDESIVNQIFNQYKVKSVDLRKHLKEKFKQMRNMLIVQEQTTEAILTKNLQYVERELKNLQAVDYKMFGEAERWLKNAKVKLENFEANKNNQYYIAFDMLENAKTTTDDHLNDHFDDNLLEDSHLVKNADIITHGEKIADQLSKVKCVNPNILASQLQKLALNFEEQLIKSLPSVSTCTCIEGVEISQEELEALKEAANAKAQSEVIEYTAPVIQEIPIANDVVDRMANLKIQPRNFLPPKVTQPQPSIPKPDFSQPVVQPRIGQHSVQELPIEDKNQPQETIDGDDLDPEFLNEIEVYLKECMENNELSIDMSETLIQDHGAKMVAAAASLCEQLQELRLKQCGISDTGAIDLFNELRENRQLQVIDISMNPITEKCLDSLAALLTCNPNLVINAQGNNIKNKFALRKMQSFEFEGRLNLQNM